MWELDAVQKNLTPFSVNSGISKIQIKTIRFSQIDQAHEGKARQPWPAPLTVFLLDASFLFHSAPLIPMS